MPRPRPTMANNPSFAAKAAKSSSFVASGMTALLHDEGHAQVDAPLDHVATIVGDHLDLVDPRAFDVLPRFRALLQAGLDCIFHARLQSGVEFDDLGYGHGGSPWMAGDA